MAQSPEKLYVQILPDDVWSHYGNLAGIFRGDGNASSPRLVKQSGLRKSDFWTVEENNETYVLPHSKYGLSFSTTIERLEGKGDGVRIEGQVWIIEKGTMIPDGLCFNYDISKPDHPLLGVSRKMPASDLIQLLDTLARRMKKTNYKIKRLK